MFCKNNPSKVLENIAGKQIFLEKRNCKKREKYVHEFKKLKSSDCCGKPFVLVAAYNNFSCVFLDRIDCLYGIYAEI